jgi:hypothetical protein
MAIVAACGYEGASLGASLVFAVMPSANKPTSLSDRHGTA